MGADSTRLSVRELPPSERPRERLLAHGAGALTDAQLLALLLAEGTRGESAVDCAQRMLLEAGSLERLAAHSPVQLQRVRGVGPAKAARVAAALELARRLEPSGTPPGPGFTGAADVYARMGPRLARRTQESFVVLCCDVKNRVIAEREVTRGTLDASLVHPRDVFRTAVQEAAAALILVHNHPSGDPEPSAEDVALTRRLADAGELMGIPVLDHVVIGHGRYASLAERGIL